MFKFLAGVVAGIHLSHIYPRETSEIYRISNNMIKDIKKKLQDYRKEDE
jgi:hypothetical protein